MVDDRLRGVRDHDAEGEDGVTMRVLGIRRLAAQGMTAYGIGKKLKMHNATVYKIVKGTVFKHVT